MGRPRRSHETSAVLRREIDDGRFRGASILPGERQLALSLDVSRSTLRRALAELIEEGVLSQRHGMGTFVNAHVQPPKPDYKKIPVEIPLVKNLNGRIDRSLDVSRGLHGATMDESMAFGIAPAGDVFRIARVLFVTGRPDAVEYASAPLRFLTGDPSTIGGSLPDAILSQGHGIAKKLQRLRSGLLGPEDAEHLGALPHSAAIIVDDAYFTREGACCALSRAFYPASRFDAIFSVPMQRDDLTVS